MQLTISPDLFNNLVQYSNNSGIHYKKLAAHLINFTFNTLQNGQKLYVQEAGGGLKEVIFDLVSLRSGGDLNV